MYSNNAVLRPLRTYILQYVVYAWYAPGRHEGCKRKRIQLVGLTLMAGYCSKAQQHQSVAGDQRHLPFQPIAYKEMLCTTVAEERDDLGPQHAYSCFVQPIPPLCAGVGLGTGHICGPGHY